MKLFQNAVRFIPDEKALGLLSGLYKSAFKGRGLEYEDLRQYMPGDDPKIFAWSKFAQTGQLYSKTFREERDLTVYIVVDPTPSMAWQRPQKQQLTMETVALLAFSAVKSRDKLGVVSGSFYDKKCEFFPAIRGKGIHHAEKMTEKLSFALDRTAYGNKMGLENGSLTLLDCLKPLELEVKQSGAMIFILSDFLNMDEKMEESFRRLQQRADVILIQILDLWDQHPCSLGEAFVRGAPHSEFFGPITHRFHRDIAHELEEILQKSAQKVLDTFSSSGIDCVLMRESEQVDTKEDISYPYKKLRSFFEHRITRNQKKGSRRV